jgi:hypothetical protein
MPPRKNCAGTPFAIKPTNTRTSSCRKIGTVIQPRSVGSQSQRQNHSSLGTAKDGVRLLCPDDGKQSSRHRPRAVRSPKPVRDVPTFTGDVQIPFWAFGGRLTEHLELSDDDAAIWQIATGDEAPPLERPNDPLTAWVALAYHGGIELGGPVLRRELDREQRLDVAKQVLSEDEWLVVETIAVPRRYRRKPARQLEEIIRNAADYRDRMWASCWLTLVGWTLSEQCSFGDVSKQYPLGELEHTILDCYAQSRGVNGRSDTVGWRRICGEYETNLVLHRLAICEVHYKLNGPPPYDEMRDTVPGGDGWKEVVRLVPAEYSR